ncbi:tripartite tricarboxylate transporter permease [Candidatus Woesearchaeota archaeon]|nr:tripartite tricarboxylate transporter permease [Candidatus Woesearchaeota archaeon]
MFWELLLAIIIGVMFGTFTGLAPGIHINLVAALVLSFSPLLLLYVSVLSLCAFIVAMAITHTFLDALPGIYLGAPDADQALNALPGHRLLMRGEGHAAVACTVVGSLFALLLCLIAFPLAAWAMVIINPYIHAWVGHLLVGLITYLIWREATLEKRVWAFILFSLAGLLGYSVLDLTLSQPLFPLLSGLFGISLLLQSLSENTKIPAQNKQQFRYPFDAAIKPTIGASLVGFLAAFLPGFGSSQAAIVASAFLKEIKEEGFLILVGGINTVNMALSLATVFMLDKARNGAIVIMQELLPELTFTTLLVYITAALIAGGIASILALKISRGFAALMQHIPYKTTVGCVIGFIVMLAAIFDGWKGLLILATATAIGTVASKKSIAKHHLMGCLLVPVILYFLVH